MQSNQASRTASLDDIITRARKEYQSTNSGSNTELEIRFQNVSCLNFQDIYQALLSGRTTDGKELPITEKGVVSQTANIIMDEVIAGNLRANNIRELTFVDGKKSKDVYIKKTQLVRPFQTPKNSTVSYNVALSSETPDRKGFMSDNSAMVRVKARVGFEITVQGVSETKHPHVWVIDMTVVRQFTGGDIPTIMLPTVNQMFATTPKMTPANFLNVLNISDAQKNLAVQSKYQYQVEAEYKGENINQLRAADIAIVTSLIWGCANPLHASNFKLQNAISHVAQYIYQHRNQTELNMKKMLPPAIAITRTHWRTMYPPRDMYLTEKADGERALVIIRDGVGIIATSIYLDDFKPTVDIKSNPIYTTDTIIDGEYVSSISPPTFFAFDIIAVAGEDVSNLGFEDRLDRIAEAVEIAQHMGLPVRAKGYVHLVSTKPSDLARDITAVYETKRTYKVDGLIFVEPKKSYMETSSYKWKPAHDNTIDMLARRAPSRIVGHAPFVNRTGCSLYFLFVGVNPMVYSALGLQRCPGYEEMFDSKKNKDYSDSSANYFPIQFSPSDSPMAYLYQHPNDSPFGEIDNNVVELRCTSDFSTDSKVDWEITKIRTDRKHLSKYYGNDIMTAESVWRNYIDPFPIEQLWSGSGSEYFMVEKSTMYKAQTGCTSFFKNQRISKLEHSEWVVDLCAGKGQDLMRYKMAGVKHFIAVDIDKSALTELIRRKYDMAKRPNAPHNKQRNSTISKKTSSTAVHVLAADVRDPFMQTVEKLERLGLVGAKADAVVCNLALHYFVSDMVGMRNFASLSKHIVRIGGQVILTIMIGEAVHELLSENKIGEGESWDAFEVPELGAPPIRKYSVRRLYSSDELTATGQRIGVLLPFSNGEYYEEYLINTSTLITTFTNKGFKLSSRNTITQAIPEFARNNSVLAKQLTDADKQWLGLYGDLVFVRER